MFDIGFSELLLFGVIALVVLGPEKLPHAARTAGQWYAKIRRTVSTLQSEIEAELDLAETRQKMQEELEKIKQAEAEMKKEMAELRGSMKEFEDSQNQSLTPSIQNTSVDSTTSDNPVYAYGKDPAIIDGHAPHHTSNLEVLDTQALETVPSQTASSKALLAETIEKSTKPWVGMWFLLSDYDRIRRLPSPPFRPNYQADKLLNTPVSAPIDTSMNISTDKGVDKHTSAYPSTSQGIDTEKSTTQLQPNVSTEIKL